MPILRLCRDADFSPEDAARLATAYESTLRSLGLVDRDDPIAELVARKILEISRTGVCDPGEISNLALKDLQRFQEMGDEPSGPHLREFASI